MMNLLGSGAIECFSPVSYLSRKDLTMIRPLIFTREREIESLVKRTQLPVVKSLCPVDGATHRQRIKDPFAANCPLSTSNVLFHRNSVEFPFDACYDTGEEIFFHIIQILKNKRSVFMYCRNCGAPLADNAVVCARCGATVTPPAPPLARSSPTKANSNPITPHTISTPMASSPIHSRRIAPAQAFMCSPSFSPLLA